MDMPRTKQDLTDVICDYILCITDNMTLKEATCTQFIYINILLLYYLKSCPYSWLIIIYIYYILKDMVGKKLQPIPNKLKCQGSSGTHTDGYENVPRVLQHGC